MEKSENKNRKGEVHLGKSKKSSRCLRSQAGATERGGNAGRADKEGRGQHVATAAWNARSGRFSKLEAVGAPEGF